MSSLLGPVTDADLRRWQRRRYEVLGELLDIQDGRRMAPLSWTLSAHGLVGKAVGDHDGERRAAFESWATALGLARWGEHHHDTGRIHLSARLDDLWGRGVGVTVMADLWEDHPA